MLLLCARDVAKGGRLEEVAMGVIDTEYQSFLAYEPIETLMAEFAPPAVKPEPAPEASPPLVTLKKTRKPYKPPQNPDAGKETDEQGQQ